MSSRDDRGVTVGNRLEGVLLREQTLPAAVEEYPRHVVVRMQEAGNHSSGSPEKATQLQANMTVMKFQSDSYPSSLAEVQVHCIINSKLGSGWINILNRAVFVIGNEAIRNRAMRWYERS
jgi:hypothetical protein